MVDLFKHGSSQFCTSISVRLNQLQSSSRRASSSPAQQQQQQSLALCRSNSDCVKRLHRSAAAAAAISLLLLSSTPNAHGQYPAVTVGLRGCLYVNCKAQFKPIV